MVSEETIMNIMCYEKKISIKILRICFELNLTDVVSEGILSIAVVNLTINIIYEEIDNFLSFVSQILLALTVLAAGVRLYMIVNNKDIESAIHRKITTVDVHLDKDISSKNDPELFALLGLVVWIFFGVTLWSFHLAFIFGNGWKFAEHSLACASLVLSIVPLVRAVALKQLIVKRLRQVASVDRLDLELVVGCTRLVVGCNSVVNNSCWMQALVCAITLFHQCLTFLYFFWVKQVKQHETVEALILSPVITALAHSGFYMVILLLAEYSSRVRDQIEEIQFMLDWAKQEKKIDVQEKEIMSLFTLELHHTRVELSATGLFEFNRITIVAVIGALISYEMVLIQFS